MARRYIGDAIVTINYREREDDYKGSIRAGGQTWRFDGLHAAPASRFARDSAQAYDEMAGSAVSFGSYYTTHNRGDDVPEWAPDPEVADAIDEATAWAMDDQGNYDVKRKKPSKNPPRRGLVGKRNPQTVAEKERRRVRKGRGGRVTSEQAARIMRSVLRGT